MASLCKNLQFVRLGARSLLSTSMKPLLNPPRPHLWGYSKSTAPSVLRSFHNIAPTSSPPAESTMLGYFMETRKAPPAHYLVEIDSFSLYNKRGIDKFETKAFEAGGYKWKLIVYPNGHGYEKDSNVSASLALADTSALPPNWEVNVVSSVSLFNHKTDSFNYALGRMCFNAMKTESSFLNLISKEYFMDPSSGYLIDDKCVFGAEVFVKQDTAVMQPLSLKNVNLKVTPHKHKLTISNFPSFSDGWNSHKTWTWTSDEFIAFDQKWKLKVYPNGVGEASGRFASILLQRVASDNSLQRVKASYAISLKSQVSDEAHVTRESIGRWFSTSPMNKWGWTSFVDLASLNDPKKGYIVDGCVHLGIELSVEAIEELDVVPFA